MCRRASIPSTLASCAEYSSCATVPQPLMTKTPARQRQKITPTEPLSEVVRRSRVWNGRWKRSGAGVACVSQPEQASSTCSSEASVFFSGSPHLLTPYAVRTARELGGAGGGACLPGLEAVNAAAVPLLVYS